MRVANLQGRGNDASPFLAYGYSILLADERFGGTSTTHDATVTAVNGATLGETAGKWMAGSSSYGVYAGFPQYGSEQFGTIGCDDIWGATPGKHASTCNGFIQLEFSTTVAWHASEVKGWTATGYYEGRDGYTGRVTCTSWEWSQDCMPFQPEYSTVPEPITVLLLGTGLAGIGAMRARRRKKDELA